MMMVVILFSKLDDSDLRIDRIDIEADFDDSKTEETAKAEDELTDSGTTRNSFRSPLRTTRRWQKEDYFRTGRITKGVSYNIMTGKLMADEHEKIEIVEKKNEADLTSETEKSTSSGYKSTKDLENEIMSFSDVFSAIPRAFNYADSLP
ncbi:unnamed protein product, partial [Caenorhabditis auriculariae]